MAILHYVDADELRILIDLADNPRDVRIDTSYTARTVVVPDELVERYQRYQSLESSPPKEPKKSGSKK